MQSKGPKTKQYLNAYSWLLPPVAVIMAGAIGWPVFWYVKSRETAAALEAWTAHEAQLGRAWSCPTQKIGGFPFSVEISCANLLFQGEILGKTMSGTLRGFRATSPLLRTDNLRAEIDSPFAAKTSDGTFDITMQWGELFLDLEGRPGALNHLSQLQSGPAARKSGEDGRSGRSVLAMSMSFSRGTGTTMSMISCLRSTRARFRRSTSLLDTQLPIDMQVGGTISQVDLRGAETLRSFLKIGARRTDMSISRPGG